MYFFSWAKSSKQVLYVTKSKISIFLFFFFFSLTESVLLLSSFTQVSALLLSHSASPVATSGNQKYSNVVSRWEARPLKWASPASAISHTLLKSRHLIETLLKAAAGGQREQACFTTASTLCSAICQFCGRVCMCTQSPSPQAGLHEPCSANKVAVCSHLRHAFLKINIFVWFDFFFFFYCSICFCVLKY